MSKSTKKKVVSKKKTIVKKVVAKKKVVTKKKPKAILKKLALAVNKNHVPATKPSVAPTLSPYAFTVTLNTGGKEYVTKTETLGEAVEELKVLIPSPALIKTKSTMVIEQAGKSCLMQFHVFPLKRLLHSHGDVRKIIFAKHVGLLLK
jgi:hypothetical protein